MPRMVFCTIGDDPQQKEEKCSNFAEKWGICAKKVVINNRKCLKVG